MTAPGRAALRVAWISDTAPAGLTSDLAFFEHHRQASLRFRVGIPARVLRGYGVESVFVGLDTPAILEHLTRERVDAVVFSKLSTPRGATYEAFTTAYLGTARHAREQGLAVVVDLVDNVFATDRREFFLELLGRADAVTVASESLGEACRVHTSLPVDVIGDPVEGERRPPRFEPPRRALLSRLARGRSTARSLRALWFGGQYRNFLDLAALLPALQGFACTHPLELEVVANADERIRRRLETLGAVGSPALTARFTEWSLREIDDALERCDVVLLPADLSDEMRATASANRLVRALWAGRPVIAHPLASYLEFRDAALLGPDLVAALDWALAHPRQVLRQVTAGQDLILRQHGREAVALRWRATTAAAIEAARVRSAA